MTPDDLDAEAIELCRKYRGSGESAVLVRTSGDGADLRIVTPAYPNSYVAEFLRYAADCLDRAPDRILN